MNPKRDSLNRSMASHMEVMASELHISAESLPTIASVGAEVLVETKELVLVEVKNLELKDSGVDGGRKKVFDAAGMDSDMNDSATVERTDTGRNTWRTRSGLVRKTLSKLARTIGLCSGGLDSRCLSRFKLQPTLEAT